MRENHSQNNGYVFDRFRDVSGCFFGNGKRKPLKSFICIPGYEPDRSASSSRAREAGETAERSDAHLSGRATYQKSALQGALFVSGSGRVRAEKDHRHGNADSDQDQYDCEASR